MLLNLFKYEIEPKSSMAPRTIGLEEINNLWQLSKY